MKTMEPMEKMRKIPSLDWLREKGYRVNYDRQISAYLIRTKGGTLVGTSYYGDRIFVKVNSPEGKTLDKLLG